MQMSSAKFLPARNLSPYLYVCIEACILMPCTYVCIQEYAYIHAYMHAYIQMIFVSQIRHTYMHTHTYMKCMCIHLHTHKYMRTRLHIYVLVHHTCLQACEFMSRGHKHTHACMHTYTAMIASVHILCTCAHCYWDAVTVTMTMTVTVTMTVTMTVTVTACTGPVRRRYVARTIWPAKQQQRSKESQQARHRPKVWQPKDKWSKTNVKKGQQEETASTWFVRHSGCAPRLHHGWVGASIQKIGAKI